MNCRSTSRNANQKQLPEYVHFVHQKLLHNRQLLCELNRKEKAKVDRQELLSRGFHADYFTNIYQARKGTTYYFCYDYGYCLLPNDKILIVKLQPYV